MLPKTVKPRWWHNRFKNLAATPFGVWFMSNSLHHIDKLFLKLTHNRTSFTFLLSGVPVIQLTSKGAKSGLPRQLPLVAVADEDKLVLIASFYGNPHHPAWFYNLKANPAAEVTYGQKTARFTARKAEGPERSRYWAMAAALFPGYNIYQRMAANREIPVIVLEPLISPSNDVF